MSPGGDQVSALPLPSQSPKRQVALAPKNFLKHLQ